MDSSQPARESKYFFIACFLALVVTAIVLVKSFVTTIISAVVLSYIFHPLYKRIKAILRSENVAALLTIIIVIIIIIIPLIFAANALINESIDFFYKLKAIDVNQVQEFIRTYTTDKIDIQGYYAELLQKIPLSIAKATSDYLVSIPKRILEFFVMLFIVFYLLKEGPAISERIKNHIPLKESYRKHLEKKFNGIVYASLYGLVLTAFIQGIVGALGLWIFNVPSPILWGMVMVIVSMLPFVGAWMVWFPAALYKIFIINDTFNGVGLMVYGILIVSTIDNIVRPKIIGAKGKIHPILVLLGVLGGLQVFGFLGIIIGPLILAIMMVFVEHYFLEKKE